MSIAGDHQLPGDELKITVQETGDGHPTRIVLRGELDMAGVPRLRATVDALFANPVVADITIDLAELTFCDSTGLTEFVRTDHALQTRGHHLRLRKPTEPIQQILALTHLDAALDVD